MDAGERKYVLLAACIVGVCVTILFSFLFVALWQFKLLVGVCLLVILLSGTFSLCVVALRGSTQKQPLQSAFLPLKQETGYDDRFP
jgi:hypothetical protein